MLKKSLLLFVLCCLSSLLVQLRAGSVTYDLSSTAHWVTSLNGTTHPSLGVSFGTVYYAATGDKFVGSGSVSFGKGYLTLSKDASLGIPCNTAWTVNKVILHSHSGGSTSVNVNIYDEYGISKSESQKWEKQDSVYEYSISSTEYKYSNLYVKAKDAAARITSITIEYTSPDDPTDDPTHESSVSAPIFNPISTSFSTESLDVTIEVAEGCEVYYTKDGSAPSYTDSENYVGTRGNTVTIYASESKVTLQAIAVDPATGKCSNVSSATYTYVQVVNDGKTKEKAYTVAELKTMSYSTNKQDKWVRGSICGAVDGSNKLVTSNITIETNIAIGDENAYVAVQLPNNSKIRNHANLKDHPYMMGKELLVRGDLAQYLVPFVGVQTPTEYEVFYDVPINSYGYATLYLDMPVLVPAGITAYYCTIEDNYAELYSVGSIIPSNTGVILESATNKNTTCALTYTTSRNVDEAAILEDNKLVGFMHDTKVGSDGSAYYALNVKNNQLGFYIPQTAADPEDAASGFTAKAKKAYLQVPAEQKASMFVIHRAGDESAIVPSTHMCDEAIYDLQGRIVVSPTSGVYIRGGQKFVVRK